MLETVRLEHAAVLEGPLSLHSVRVLSGGDDARCEVYNGADQSPVLALRSGPSEESAAAGRWSADDPAGRQFASIGVQLLGEAAVVELVVERVDWAAVPVEAAGVVVRTRS